MDEIIVKVIPITKDNVDVLVDKVLASYLGETCPFCGKVYQCLKDLDNVVWYPNDKGRIACESCYKGKMTKGSDQ